MYAPDMCTVKSVLVTGSHGLIGSELVDFFETEGYKVDRAVRNTDEAGLPVWDLSLFDGSSFDAIVHLAGENVASGRWTRRRQDVILNSRKVGTQRLCQAVLDRLSAPPQVFICASAVGYYGTDATGLVDEDSRAGQGFLAHVCQEWEDSTKLLGPKTRVVHARIGIVLCVHGGALGKMITPFKLCFGGVLGSGDQGMSWITLSDVVAAMEFILRTPSLSGPVNLVSPGTVTNAEFTRSLARAIGRPALCHVPAFVLECMLGKDMAEGLLLTGPLVRPRNLLSAGFTFQYPDLDVALEYLLQQQNTAS